MAQRGGKLAKEGKTLNNKHFEQHLLLLEEKNPSLRMSGEADRFEWDKDKQRYTNIITQAMYLGYTFGLNASRTYADGHFIVAEAGPVMGRPIFASQPFVHRAYGGARAELKRLARRYRGKSFILYNSIQVEKALPILGERERPEGCVETGAIDDNSIPIFLGDELVHYKGWKGDVCRTDEGFVVVSPYEAKHLKQEQYPLNKGSGWLIVEFNKSQVEPVEEEPALDESFSLTAESVSS